MPKDVDFEHDGVTVAVGVRKHKLCEMLFEVLKAECDEVEANLVVKGSLQS